jgi:hypothetical protein
LRSISIIVTAVAAALALAIPAGAQASAARARHRAHHIRVTQRMRANHLVFDNYPEPVCESKQSLCTDSAVPLEGEYVGHDEPSLEFKSGIPGSGNDATYTMTLPTDPTTQPNATGDGGTTWNFQLRPTFWFGMTMCDTQSAPEFTNKCTPDSDANNLVGTVPKNKDYIGKHPGNAYMELQFYGPGYVPQFEGFGCTGTQYCAAMTIDSRTIDQNNGVENTAACDNYILGGPEPINWAYITHNGVSQAPANPLFTGTFSNPNFDAVNPDTTKDLMMNPGDTIRIHMFDTSAGFRVVMNDLTTGDSGSMTASTANGFGHIMYTPQSKKCTAQPYAFHPEYSTANTRGNTWSVHTYNVAESDEIGHFENCQAIDANFNCTQPGFFDGGATAKPDNDDGQNFCVPGTDSTVVKIDGCFAADSDWDAQSYQMDWPGTNPNSAMDALLHPSTVLFTSPLTSNGTEQYSKVAFETDLPRLEEADSQDNAPFCNVSNGTNCVNPPNGAAFYPFFSTSNHNGTCTWQEGGPYIPGTTNDFGGSSTAEFGPLLAETFPVAGPTIVTRLENFNSGDITNPCFVTS